MNTDIEFRIAEIERRLRNMIRHGTVDSVDAAAKTCRVKLSDTHTTGDLRWSPGAAGKVRRWRAPTKGEQVTIISEDGDISRGIVIPSIYCTAFDAPSSDPDVDLTQYSDGTSISYNLKTHRMKIESVGDLDLIAARNVTISGARIDLN